MIRLAAAVVREICFFVGEYGGVLLDKITGYDLAAEEARLKAEIIASYTPEGE